jgi:hypothetical protein
MGRGSQGPAPICRRCLTERSACDFWPLITLAGGVSAGDERPVRNPVTGSRRAVLVPRVRTRIPVSECLVPARLPAAVIRGTTHRSSMGEPDDRQTRDRHRLPRPAPGQPGQRGRHAALDRPAVPHRHAPGAPTRLAYGRPVASATGSASMSARSSAVGPGPLRSTPTTPVPPTPSVVSNPASRSQAAPIPAVRVSANDSSGLRCRPRSWSGGRSTRFSSGGP